MKVLNTKYHILNTGGTGYIAITAALIIAAVVMVLVSSLGASSFFGRSAISTLHFKKKSSALASACVDTALLKLVASSSYGGGETITVASDTCQIVSVVSTSTGKVISSQGVFQRSYTNLKVTITTSTPFSIASWEEVKSF